METIANKASKIVVLLREVCDPKVPAQPTVDGFGIKKRSLRYLPNPADLCGLEKAQQLAEQTGSEVIAVTVGPDRTEDLLRLSLACGAKRAIRVNIPDFDNVDVHVRARIIERILEILVPELFITGNRLLDRGNDPVPALASARRKLPCISNALSLDSDNEEIRVLRKSDRGSQQLVGVTSPCALFFNDGCCEPRYPDHASIMASLLEQIETWNSAELGLSQVEVDESAALLKRDQFSFPRSNPRRVVTPDAGLPAFERILALLSGGIKPRAGKKYVLPAEQTVDKLMEIFRAEGMLGAE